MRIIYVDVRQLLEHEEKMKVKSSFEELGWDSINDKMHCDTSCFPNRVVFEYFGFTSWDVIEPSIPNIPACCTISYEPPI